MLTNTGPIRICPHCQGEVDSHTGVANPDTDVPEEGDASLCLYCGLPSIFTKDMMLRLPTEEERVQMMADENVIATMAAIQMLRDGLIKVEG